MIFAISSIWKLIFMHLGSVELMGLLTNIFYLKTNLVEPSGWPDEILSSIWNMFFNTPRISSIWKKTDFWLSSIWKGVWLTIPWSKKLKNPWFFQVFHWPPPRWRRFQSSSGRVPSRELLWHRRRRVVTRVRASMFYWFYIICLEKQQKMAVGQKKQIEDIAQIIPKLKGLFFDFWSFELLWNRVISSIWNGFCHTPERHLL